MKTYKELIESAYKHYDVKGVGYGVFLSKNPEGSELIAFNEVSHNKLNALVYNNKHVFVWYEDVPHKIIANKLRGDRDFHLTNPAHIKIDTSGSGTKITILDKTDPKQILNNKYIVNNFKNIEIV